MSNRRSTSIGTSGSINDNSAMFGSSAGGRSSQAMSVGGRSSAMYSLPSSQASAPSQRCCGGCISSPRFRLTALFLKRCIKSLIWRGFSVLFSVFLLFGSQMRHLWVPESADQIFDIISIVAFAFFILDMMIRIMVEPNYFNFNVCVTNRTQFAENKESSANCVLGSFIFWCDLISTATLLYDISFINKAQYQFTELHIELDANGSPTTNFKNLNRFGNLDGIKALLLVTIARSARVARFVRSRIVLNACNKVNWYWPCDQFKWFNPFFYRRKLRRSSKQKRTNSLGIAGGEGSGSFVRPTQDKRMGPGVLQIGMSAAVKAREQAQREQEPFFKRILRSMGLLENERVRNEAARKIQRTWRAHSKKSRDDRSSSTASNSVDVFHKTNQASSLGGSRRGTFRFGSEGVRGSRFQLKSGTLNESQVGSDMRELTGQRVALGVLLSLIFTVVFCYMESSTTTATTMLVLHNQTQNPNYQQQAIESAKDTSAPDLFQYETTDGVPFYFPLEGAETNGTELKSRDKLRVTVIDSNDLTSLGWFSIKNDRAEESLASVVATFFIIIVWFFGVMAFSGPVMVLVVTPIERMVRLLGMLMLDPLGYQSTARFKRFLKEEDALIKGTRWTKDVLRGMETSFLMSTILRIGSLMKVGFGTAGVEIIRNNLRKGQSKNVLILSSQGTTVSCIFLFCDIRQFTDATECLQEEVFVFTNRIAAVVHSICHAYGGAANKNVGDAFLLSWSLEDSKDKRKNKRGSFGADSGLEANNFQGDKALLSVVKICLSLYYDKHYLEPLSEYARTRLKDKVLQKRSGPVVSMGFGLHAGLAVQGAIGSQRKIDATYVSEAVKRAEFLESETKTYGLKMLMSGSFHSLLHPNTRRRCRKVDQVYIPDDDEDGDDDYALEELSDEDLIHLYTFDMDVDALFRAKQKGRSTRSQMSLDGLSDATSDDVIEPSRVRKVNRTKSGRLLRQRNRRSSATRQSPSQQLSTITSEELNVNGGNVLGNQSEATGGGGASVGSYLSMDEFDIAGSPELVLPKGPALYSLNIWQSHDMKRMREKYVTGLFFQNYNTALQSFYNKDWDMAKQMFQTVLEKYDDGPSKYFMEEMEEHNGIPPRDFTWYRKC